MFTLAKTFSHDVAIFCDRYYRRDTVPGSRVCQEGDDVPHVARIHLATTIRSLREGESSLNELFCQTVSRSLVDQIWDALEVFPEEAPRSKLERHPAADA